MNIENLVREQALRTVEALYGINDIELVQVSKTRREFEGDYTLVVFPLLKASRKGPEQTAQEIGENMAAREREILSFNVIKGFLNLTLSEEFWAQRFGEIAGEATYGFAQDSGRTIMVEYSSPNTNKPLHLGHIRNNLLGYSVATVMQANGHRVVKANLVNDRGIHICKSMLAWQKFGGGETPETSGLKGDHLAGKYYVEFDRRYKAEIAELTAAGMDEEQARQKAPSMVEAQEMLRRWEAGDVAVRELWERMNGWVYDGFDKTYAALGVDFDKIDYESQTYLLGKEIVEDGLRRGVFYRKDDGSVWIDLTDDGLDNKLLLRADGTSVYMTQDLGTAVQRFTEYRLDKLIYVVGNEQNYHFQALKLILGKLGYEWAENIYHLSYGMVELPEGKMKSREGTVVDADDLIADMIGTAREMSAELGKLDGIPTAEAENISRMVGMGALKYFILKVDPKKTMLFDPRESIDFNGNTGPFIQYTHARIRSILRKAAEAEIAFDGEVTPSGVSQAEIELIKLLADFPQVVSAAGENFSPALVAQYAYDLAKSFNGYYHDNQILREERADVRHVRLQLCEQVARVISRAMSLLGIEVPERM
ncbi:MAG: arginine--tRNA ligase [Rikenellaceae bacterium]|nr:arginine--tRNA ligase [Rikenellaceae bacterium]MCL2692866.1 arginine--tRNA ligase [Rikenellaceae bacterium]